MTKNILKLSLITLSVLALTSCESTGSFMDNYSAPQTSGKSYSSASLDANSPVWTGNTTTVWNKLQQVPLQKLETADMNDPTIAGWAKLAIISKREGNKTTDLIPALIAWRTQYPNHPGNSLFPDNAKLTQLLNTSAPQHIAILLPLTGPVGQQGKIVRSGYLKAYYANHAQTKHSQTVAFYDTSLSPDISSIYQKALSDGADFIVGPLTKESVQTLSQQNRFNYPTLALNYTDTNSLPNNFYEFGLSPVDEAQQLADKARSEGRSSALIITTQNEWGQRVAKELTSRWQTDGGKVQEVLYIAPNADLTQSIAALLQIHQKVDRDNKPLDNSKTALEQERRHDFDVIFLLTPPQTARQVVPLLRYYYVNNVPLYATSVVYSGTPSPTRDMDINGVTFADIPWVLHGKHSSRLAAVGTDAYTISNEMPRLTNIPHFPIYGATGAMTLNSKQQIYRRLPWTTIHNGQPQH